MQAPFKTHPLSDALLKLVAEALMYGIIYFILDLTVPELILAIVAGISSACSSRRRTFLIEGSSVRYR